MIATAVCNTYIELGVNAYQQGYSDVADRMLNAAFDEAQRLGSRQYPPCSVFNKLAHLYYQQKNFDKAELVYEQAIVLYERIFDEGEPILVGMQLNLAELYFSRAKYELAEPLYARGLNGTTDEIAASIVEKCALKLAWIYCNQQRHDDAQKLYGRVAAIREARKAATQAG
jgi:tetratricopeptide (TPR) repeat protein